MNVTFFEIIPFVYDIDTISGIWAWKASFNEQLVVTELFRLGAKVVLHFKQKFSGKLLCELKVPIEKVLVAVLEVLPGVDLAGKFSSLKDHLHIFGLCCGFNWEGSAFKALTMLVRSK